MPKWFHTVLQNPYTPLILIFLGTLIAAVMALLGGMVYYHQQASIRNSARSRTLPKAGGFPLTVKTGGNISYLMSPTDVAGNIFGENFTVQVAADMTILLSGELRQNDGSVVGQLQQSSLSLNLVDKYDVNSDAHGFEVIDSRAEPVLQAECKEEGKLIVLNYVRYEVDPVNGRSYLMVYTEDFASRGPAGPDTSKLLSRMFKYPGYKFPGVRSRENAMARQAELAADAERKRRYTSILGEFRKLPSPNLADELTVIANAVHQLDASEEFSMNPVERDRQRAKQLAIYKNTLEAQALAARKTALTRLGTERATDFLPEYAYYSTNPTLLLDVPIDLEALADALRQIK